MKKLLTKQMKTMTTATRGKLWALLLAFLLPAVASATAIPQTHEVTDDLTDTWYLVAQLTDGEEELIPMSTVGVLVAVDDAYDFTVLDTYGYVILENVKKAVFKSAWELDPTSVRTVRQDRNLLGSVAEGRLTLIGVSGEVCVYDANGRMLLNTTAHGGETVVSVAHLPAGVYAVKCGRQTFKFVKK